MVEAPGTAPGSEWFIAAAIYRHSRQAGTSNIRANGPGRKSGQGDLRACAPPRVRSFATAVPRRHNFADMIEHCGLAIDDLRR